MYIKYWQIYPDIYFVRNRIEIKEIQEITETYVMTVIQKYLFIGESYHEL